MQSLELESNAQESMTKGQSGNVNCGCLLMQRGHMVSIGIASVALIIGFILGFVIKAVSVTGSPIASSATATEGAGIVLFSKEGDKVLLVEQTGGKGETLKWNAIGMYVKPGETLIEAAQRNLRDNNVGDAKLQDDLKLATLWNGMYDKHNNVAAVFAGTIHADAETPDVDKVTGFKGKALKWFNVEELLNLYDEKEPDDRLLYGDKDRIHYGVFSALKTHRAGCSWRKVHGSTDTEVFYGLPPKGSV